MIIELMLIYLILQLCKHKELALILIILALVLY